MKPKYSLFEKIILLVGLFPLIYLAITWKSIPNIVVTHYNARFEPDGTDNKSVLLVITAILTGMSILIFLLMKNIHRIDPKQKGTEPPASFTRLGIVIVAFFAVLNFITILSATAGAGVMQKLLFPSIGMLFVFIGNYMNNIKPNYFAGIRLPWTLSSDDNWRKTHHLAGKLWFWGGVLLIASSIFLPMESIFPIAMAIVVVLVIVPGVYSYSIFRRERRKRV